MKLSVALLVVASSALADPHTGTAVDASVVAHPSPSATLYLRCIGWGEGRARTLVDSATALVARVPGVTLDIALEPGDWNTSTVAAALAAATDTPARLLVLARLIERRGTRARGRPAPRPAGADAFVHRPVGQLEPSEAYLAVGGRALHAPPTDAELTNWAAQDTPETLRPASSSVPRYSGASGRLVVLRWHGPRDACGPLELLEPSLKHGRARVVFDVSVDPEAPIGVKLLGRAIERALPETQVALAKLACTRSPPTRESARQLLVSVGIDPDVPALSDVGPVAAHRLEGVPLTVDGKPLSYLGALSLVRPRSLRQRIASPRR